MALSLGFGAARRPIEIVREYDRERIADLLISDRHIAAYALAQLDDDAWPDAEFLVARGPSGTGLLCHSRGGLGFATTLSGAKEAVAAILRLHPGFARTFAIAGEEHLEALEAVYHFQRVTQMVRMAVTREGFRPVSSSAMEAAQPMLSAHVDLVNMLYNAEGDPTHYRPEHISDGCYWGVTDEERLVAVAGTHAIGRRHGIAIVGNVFTHPRFRSRGHGTTVTSAVTAALLEQVDEVVLSVKRDNVPALRAYNRLGYRVVGEIVEASAVRETSTLITALRRWAARRRGDDGEREVVSA